MGAKGRVLTGIRARFSLNGVKVGYARRVSLGDSYQFEPIDVIDNMETEEHVVTGYQVDTFTAGMFRIVGETLVSAGYAPRKGKSAAEHLQNVLLQGELTATIQDTKTRKNIAIVTGVKIASRNYTIDARGATGEDVTFVAIRSKDEAETEQATV